MKITTKTLPAGEPDYRHGAQNWSADTVIVMRTPASIAGYHGDGIFFSESWLCLLV